MRRAPRVDGRRRPGAAPATSPSFSATTGGVTRVAAALVAVGLAGSGSGCAGDVTKFAADGAPDAAAARLADAGGPPSVDASRDLHPADARLPAGTYPLWLDAGAFPPVAAHPNALVYVPAGFDPTPPLSLLVFLHGFNNCVENVIRDTGQSCNPAAGTPARTAYALAAQLEASHRNALLLCPEVEFDKASSNPGALAKQDAFRALVAEALARLQPVLGPRGVKDVGMVVVATHSGGYQAAAGIAVRGGIPVRELYLLDSLYGNMADYDQWVRLDIASFSGMAPARRFANIYTTSGGTSANSQQMAARAKGWVAADPGALVDDRTTATWPDSTYHHGLLFKLSGLAHDAIPRDYVGRLLSKSALPPR